MGGASEAIFCQSLIMLLSMFQSLPTLSVSSGLQFLHCSQLYPVLLVILNNSTPSVHSNPRCYQHCCLCFLLPVPQSLHASSLCHWCQFLVLSCHSLSLAVTRSTSISYHYSQYLLVLAAALLICFVQSSAQMMDDGCGTETGSGGSEEGKRPLPGQSSVEVQV